MTREELGRLIGQLTPGLEGDFIACDTEKEAERVRARMKSCGMKAKVRKANREWRVWRPA
jgi:hypothetical protein